MGRRLALVIGNAAYAHATELPNPRNDATAVADVLKELDFNVVLGTDLACNQMEDILYGFGEDIRDADAALFFFAGHGLQVKGQNYLIPVDAEIKQEIHLHRRTFSLNQILETMGRRVRNTLIFLDACRDNPFTRSYLSNLADEQRARSLVRSGLAGVTLETTKSTFIAYATSPDTVAFDGTGSHSPFTLGLLQHVKTPNVSISDMMIEVRNSVLKATNGRQRPWDQSSMQERFFFKVADTEAKFKVTDTGAKDERRLSDESVRDALALAYWDAIKGTGDPGKLRDFLAEHGATKMARLARNRLTELETAAKGEKVIPQVGQSETIAVQMPTAVPDPAPSTQRRRRREKLQEKPRQREEERRREEAKTFDYCSIGGEDLGRLATAIANAFDADELDELVRITFGEGLYQSYAGRGLTDKGLIFRLLETLERRGTIVIFLRAVRLVRPHRSDLIDLIGKLCPQAMNDPASVEERLEDERRKQEAEDRRRLDEAKAKERPRDEELRRLEEEAKLAANEAGRQTRPEQQPQQPVKLWLLPLIGAGAASLPMLLFAVWVASNVSPLPSQYIPYIFVVMIHALYGGAAGMLIERFGIPKAVAIPVIPALLLVLLVGAFFPWEWKVYLQYFLASVGFAPMARLYSTFSPEGWGLAVVVYFVPAVMCTWLAFGLHSGWALKRRMIDSGVVAP